MRTIAVFMLTLVVLLIAAIPMCLSLLVGAIVGACQCGYRYGDARFFTLVHDLLGGIDEI